MSRQLSCRAASNCTARMRNQGAFRGALLILSLFAASGATGWMMMQEETSVPSGTDLLRGLSEPTASSITNWEPYCPPGPWDWVQINAPGEDSNPINDFASCRQPEPLPWPVTSIEVQEGPQVW